MNSKGCLMLLWLTNCTPLLLKVIVIALFCYLFDLGYSYGTYWVLNVAIFIGNKWVLFLWFMGEVWVTLCPRNKWIFPMVDGWHHSSHHFMVFGWCCREFWVSMCWFVMFVARIISWLCFKWVLLYLFRLNCWKSEVGFKFVCVGELIHARLMVFELQKRVLNCPFCSTISWNLSHLWRASRSSPIGVGDSRIWHILT